MEERKPTILSFAVRASRYGYAVFAGPEKLLDWGAGEIVSHETGKPVGIRRAAFLFEHFQPDAVIVSRSPRLIRESHLRASGLIESVRREAALLDVGYTILDWQEVTAVFADSGPATRYEIASVLAGMFPDLLWKLPPKPKSTDREPHVLIAFDAVAAAVACGLPNACQRMPDSEDDPARTAS